MNNKRQVKQTSFPVLLLFVCLSSNILAVSDLLIYTNPKLYHVRHTGCTYNKNITTMNHLELNIPLPENWPDCEISNVVISGDDSLLLHNTEGPGQIYRAVYKNGAPAKGTIALVSVEYDLRLYEVDIDFDALAGRKYPRYNKDSEYEYYTRVSGELLADNQDVQAILKQLQEQSNGNPVLYAKAVYDWIAENIQYANPRPAGDLGVCLKERKGDCGAIAAFFVNFCRMAGIPTRFIAGCWAGGFDGWHCWAEFQLPEVGWIPIDHSPAGGFGHLSNNHLPLVKAGDMKFDIAEDKGSKECGFVQPGYWFFFYGGGSEGDQLDTELSVESFAYDDMPAVNSEQDVKEAYREANRCVNSKNYDRALQIYRYIYISEYSRDKNKNLLHYKMADCFLGKNQRVKAALELLPLVEGDSDQVAAEKAAKMLRLVRTQELYLDELNLSNIRQGWGSPHKKQSVEARPISIGGKEFKRGIGTHSESLCVIETNGSVEEFSAYVGVDDEVKESLGSVEFFVICDDKILWQSGTVWAGEPAKYVKIATQDAKKLVLKVSDAGDGGICDHADWADARLIISGIYPRIVPIENGTK